MRNIGPDPRESSLPKWARELLDRARMEIAETRAMLDQIAGEDPRPPVAVRDPYREKFPVAWGHYDVIEFFPDKTVRKAIQVRLDENYPNRLVVRGVTGHNLIVQPNSANAITVEAGDDR